MPDNWSHKTTRHHPPKPLRCAQLNRSSARSNGNEPSDHLPDRTRWRGKGRLKAVRGGSPIQLLRMRELVLRAPEPGETGPRAAGRSREGGAVRITEMADRSEGGCLVFSENTWGGGATSRPFFPTLPDEALFRNRGSHSSPEHGSRNSCKPSQ